MDTTADDLPDWLNLDKLVPAYFRDQCHAHADAGRKLITQELLDWLATADRLEREWEQHTGGFVDDIGETLQPTVRAAAGIGAVEALIVLVAGSTGRYAQDGTPSLGYVERMGKLHGLDLHVPEQLVIDDAF